MIEVAAESSPAQGILERIGPGHSVFIAGEWVTPGGDEVEVRSPATDEVIATVATCDGNDVDRAVAAASASFEAGEWSGTPLAKRAALFDRVAQILKEDREAIATLETLDSGGTIRRTMVDPLSQYFRDIASLLRRSSEEEGLPYADRPVPAFSILRRDPVGVCALVTPWNFPALMSAYKLAPSIAAGNSVVIKPALEAPLSTIRLVEAFTKAGLSPGVVNLVQGDGPGVGEALVAHPDVRKVSFTGSTATGRRVMQLAAADIKSVTLELGGKSPNVLLDDADLDEALPGSLFAIFLHSGQICVSGSRLLVPRSMEEEVVERLVQLASTLKIGDPLDRSTDVGPLISAKQLARVRGYIDGAVAEGAAVAAGGTEPPEVEPRLARGHYVRPTILTGVDNRMTVAREEVFGPVLAVIPYDDEEEAIALANDSDYGLAAGVWSRSIPRAVNVARKLRAGTVWVNEWHMLRHDAPYGGFGQSGIGREHGDYGLAQYLEPKHIHVSVAPTPYKVLFGNV